MNGRNSAPHTGFVKFINQMQMASFGTFNSQVLWFLGSIALTVIDGFLLTRHATEIDVIQVLDPLKASAAVSVFLAHNTAAEQSRQVGLYLAIVLIGGWTGKSVAGFFSGKNVRETSQEYIEAKERGRARGEAEVTSERPAIRTQNIEQVTVQKSDRPTKSDPDRDDEEEKHEWAEGDPRSGIL